MSHSNERTLQCSAIVRELMADNEWQLLSEDAFVDAVLNRMPLQHTVDREQFRKWGINTYCRHALYPACLGVHGRQKQARGYAELAIYLYRLAHRNWSPVAEDAAQEALVMLYDKVEDCRNPGAFLAFAIQKLRDAAWKCMRRDSREESLDALLEQDFYDHIKAGEDAETTGAKEPEEAALYADLKHQVADQIKQVRQQNPRAHRQIDAVWLRYFRELSNEEIAEVMETTPANVSVLIHRGLEKLRADEPLLEMAEEIFRRSAND